ncbi:hypothetical protein Q0Z83_038660 [Actinoplanes sichuanensis]|uniref:NACHT domain-containing protein n=1 Tax=Actinoplanes sichuanensis TaxID=512349 RepID=A0ABW4A2L7_9ACTN|nr:NACHT domain-containing protein [Actinoplanes sichuanensis]BEL05675.1 hypothetical protein Q0Z83_038660 [Actinoplanes sichuanensis]
MRYSWQRRTKADRRLWALVVVALLPPAFWAAAQLDPTNDQLDTLADQSQVVSLILAVIIPVVALARFVQTYRNNHQGVADWGVELGQRVRRAESDNLAAMLSHTRPVDVTLTAGSPQPELMASSFVFDDSTEPMTLDDIGELYTSSGGGARLVIVGEPGSGKTVTSVRLILWLLDPARDYSGPVPVRFNLAAWDTSRPISRFFVDTLARDHRVPVPRAEELVEQGRILPVLDGLDEMDLDGDEPVRAIAATDWLNRRHRVGEKPGGMVLTCRQTRYTELGNRESTVAGAREVRVLELDPDQITDHLREAFETQPSVAARWQPVLTSLKDPDNAVLWALLARPWQLNLAVTAVQAGRDPQELFQRADHELPAAASARIHRELLGGYVHAATKVAEAGRPEGEAPPYTSEQVTRYLTTLARRLQNPDLDDRGHPVVDIVPHELFATSRLPRLLHAGTAGLLVAAACVVVALQTIGTPSDWLAATADFLGNGARTIIAAVFGEIIPFAGLVCTPLIAAWLASGTTFSGVPRAKAKGRWWPRYRRGLRAALPGIVVATTAYLHLWGAADAFDVDIWSSDLQGDLLMTVVVVAVMALGGLVWSRLRGVLRAGTVLGLSLITLLSEFLYLPRLNLEVVGYQLTYLLLWTGCLAACFHWTGELAGRFAALPHFRRSLALPAGAGVIALPIWLAEVLGEAFAGSFVTAREIGMVVGIGAGVVSGLLAAVRRHGGGAVVGSATGLCVGLAAVTIDGPYEYVDPMAYAGLLGLAGCLVAGAAIAVLRRDPLPADARPQLPMAVVQDDLISAVQTAVVIGVPTFFALAFGAVRAVGLTTVDPMPAAFAAVAAGAGFGLFGRRSWFRFAIGWGIAVARGRLPLTFTAFLRWAAAAGLLRTSGSAYQFRHLELQQWLLQREPSPARVLPPRDQPAIPG